MNDNENSLQQQSDVSVHRADVAEERADVSGKRADVAEKRADESGRRADVSEHRADVSEHRADKAERTAFVDRRVSSQQAELLGDRVNLLVDEVARLKSTISRRNLMVGIAAALVFGFGVVFVALLSISLSNQGKIIDTQKIVVAVTGCNVGMSPQQCQKTIEEASIKEGTLRIDILTSRFDCIVRSINAGEPPLVTKQACTP